MFRNADAVLLTKADLLGVLDDFDPARAEAHVRNLANAAPVLTVSARQRDLLAPWLTWLEDRVGARRMGLVQRPRIARGASTHASGAAT
jgi:hydrogenase nickel incorporation protein HypB